MAKIAKILYDNANIQNSAMQKSCNFAPSKKIVEFKD